MKQLFFICFLLFSVHLFASSIDSLTVKTDKETIVQKKFDKKSLDKYKKSEDFNYTEEKIQQNPTLLERVLGWLLRMLGKILEWIFGGTLAPGILSFIVKIFPYIVLAIALFLIVKIFLKAHTRNILLNAKNKPVVYLTEEEELIKSKDLPKLIKQAIEQKNFRLAVRYYYLQVLKQLEDKEVITWEQQKTNEDYIKEISTINIKNSFKNLTRLYDFVWYGNFEINEIEFAKVESDFQNTTKIINS